MARAALLAASVALLACGKRHADKTTSNSNQAAEEPEDPTPKSAMSGACAGSSISERQRAQLSALGLRFEAKLEIGDLLACEVVADRPQVLSTRRPIPLSIELTMPDGSVRSQCAHLQSEQACMVATPVGNSPGGTICQPPAPFRSKQLLFDQNGSLRVPAMGTYRFRVTSPTDAIPPLDVTVTKDPAASFVFHDAGAPSYRFVESRAEEGGGGGNYWWKWGAVAEYASGAKKLTVVVIPRARVAGTSGERAGVGTIIEPLRLGGRKEKIEESTILVAEPTPGAGYAPVGWDSADVLVVASTPLVRGPAERALLSAYLRKYPSEL